jgi:hypothetical protein
MKARFLVLAAPALLVSAFLNSGLLSGPGMSRSKAKAAEDGRPSYSRPNTAEAHIAQEERPNGRDPQAESRLGVLFGAAKTLAEGAARVAADGADEGEVKKLIETAADGVRAGLAVADEALPPLNPKDAKEFGDSFRESLLAEHKPIADRKTKDLIMPIWTAVLQASKQPADSVTLTLLEDKENNAFAFVGRNIVVNRGFVAFASECAHTKDVIRFTLAHELGHIVHGHTDTLFRRMMAADKVVPGGGVAPLVVETIIRQTPISQAAEREADCFARSLHIANGWSLDGGKEFFTRVQSMKARSDSGMAIDSLFGSHPDEKRRLESVESGDGCN